MKRRVLVSGGHPSVRENLRYLVDAEPDLCCVGAARDGAQCLALCAELQPDVLVLDDDLKGIDGISVARTLERSAPRIRVVVYTLDPGVCDIARAFGAAACVSKTDPYSALLQDIRTSSPRPPTAA